MALVKVLLRSSNHGQGGGLEQAAAAAASSQWTGKIKNKQSVRDLSIVMNYYFSKKKVRTQISPHKMKKISSIYNIDAGEYFWFTNLCIIFE